MRLFAILVLLFALLSVPVLATEALNINWTVADEKVRPGGQTSVQLTFSNPSLSATPQAISVYVTAGKYLTVTPGAFSFASLGPGATQTTVLDVKVAENALSTTDYITVKTVYKVSGVSRDTIVNIPIKIRREPILVIENVSFTETLEPGSTTTLSFLVRNIGIGPAEDLKISLGKNELFVPAESSGEFVISSLPAGSSVKIKFPLTISPDAEPDVYGVSIDFDYSDESRTEHYQESKQIGLVLVGRVEFLITLDKTENLYYGKAGMVSVAISNVGTAPAEYLSVKLESPYGQKEYYVGTLDPDDTEILDLEQDLKRADAAYTLNIQLTWKDKFGKLYKQNKVLQLSPTQAPIEVPWFYTALLLIAIVLVYLKKKK